MLEFEGARALISVATTLLKLVLGVTGIIAIADRAWRKRERHTGRLIAESPWTWWGYALRTKLSQVPYDPFVRSRQSPPRMRGALLRMSCRRVTMAWLRVLAHEPRRDVHAQALAVWRQAGAQRAALGPLLASLRDACGRASNLKRASRELRESAMAHFQTVIANAPDVADLGSSSSPRDLSEQGFSSQARFWTRVNSELQRLRHTGRGIDEGVGKLREWLHLIVASRPQLARFSAQHELVTRIAGRDLALLLPRITMLETEKLLEAADCADHHLREWQAAVCGEDGEVTKLQEGIARLKAQLAPLNAALRLHEEAEDLSIRICEPLGLRVSSLRRQLNKVARDASEWLQALDFALSPGGGEEPEARDVPDQVWRKVLEVRKAPMSAENLSRTRELLVALIGSFEDILPLREEVSNLYRTAATLMESTRATLSRLLESCLGGDAQTRLAAANKGINECDAQHASVHRYLRTDGSGGLSSEWRDLLSRWRRLAVLIPRDLPALEPAESVLARFLQLLRLLLLWLRRGFHPEHPVPERG